MRAYLDLSFEQKYWNEGKKSVVGIDEVGRGPLAGPVVTCAVVINPETILVEGVTDSKKISKKKHPLLAQQLKESGIHFALGVGSVTEIDNLGIVGSIKSSIERSLEEIAEYHHLLMDGLPFKESLQVSSSIEFIPKGDSKSYAIAAASIIAKDYRDSLMRQLALEHPQYGWEKNAGYGTKMHREAIKTHGPSEHHRKLFIRKLV